MNCISVVACAISVNEREVVEMHMPKAFSLKNILDMQDIPLFPNILTANLEQPEIFNTHHM